MPDARHRGIITEDKRGDNPKLPLEGGGRKAERKKTGLKFEKERLDLRVLLFADPLDLEELVLRPEPAGGGAVFEDPIGKGRADFGKEDELVFSGAVQIDQILVVGLKAKGHPERTVGARPFEFGTFGAGRNDGVAGKDGALFRQRAERKDQRRGGRKRDPAQKAERDQIFFPNRNARKIRRKKMVKENP